MKNSHQHWRALSLRVPVNGDSDPWIAGRIYPQISTELMKLLPSQAGLSGEILGDTTSANGSLTEVCFHFQYEDLCAAVLALRAVWMQAKFPDRTRLTHVERFPDCS